MKLNPDWPEMYNSALSTCNSLYRTTQNRPNTEAKTYTSQPPIEEGIVMVIELHCRGIHY